MREVFSNQDLTLVSYYKGLLDEAGIPCYIRNENGGNPDVAGISFQPTLCVISDTDFEAAIAYLKSQPSPSTVSRADWKCPSCHEENPGNLSFAGIVGSRTPALRRDEGAYQLIRPA